VVSTHLLIQALSRNAIQCGKFGIEDHPAAAQDTDCACDLLYRDQVCARSHASSVTWKHIPVEIGYLRKSLMFAWSAPELRCNRSALRRGLS
jgi:hypothetical protein